LTFGAPILCVARRLSRRDLEVFRFGTAMTGGHYSDRRNALPLPIRSQVDRVAHVQRVRRKRH
jgi:hypothetical protein